MLTVVDSPEAAGELVAGRILDGLSAKAGSDRYVLGFPAGRTPVTTVAALHRLAAERNIGLDRLVVVMMDEFLVRRGDQLVLCDPAAHYSCRRFAVEAFGPGVDIRSPDPDHPDEYDRWIASFGGIDLFFVASGASDGHVGFNPPGTALDSRTRVVALADSTRRDNLATFPDFGGLDEVPTHGVTIGLATITDAREVIAVFVGPQKRAALARVLTTPAFDPAWPATVIHACASASIVADRDAAPTT